MTQQAKNSVRWRIWGTLSTTTPLHIGNGNTTTRPKTLVSDKIDPTTKEKKDIEISAVVTTGEHKPAYIPGSTIKGNMRGWMKQAGVDDKIMEQIFGSDDMKKTDAVGGKAEFHDAFITKNLTFSETDEKEPPYWCARRQTAVNVSVTINRQTGTAKEKRLFHEEYVPPAVEFGLVITGLGLTIVEVAHLLHALEKGSARDADIPLSLGAGTGDGYGRFSWQLTGVKELQDNGIKQWIQDGGKEAGAEIITKYGTAYKLTDFTSPGYNRIQAYLPIKITLNFSGSFLVNDPSRVVESVDPSRKTADHLPRLDHKGHPFFPSSAFRGAFRSQAERIINTVGGKVCRVDDLEKGCKPVSDISEIEKLCRACKVFGASGWKTVIDIAPFDLKPNLREKFTQDFIAVDRFTGGVKPGAKFDAESILDPQFTSTLKIDLKHIQPWEIGLLALLLRDLEEGDITFGFGASKGYGSCIATTSWNIAPLRTLPAFEILKDKTDKGEFLKLCVKAFIEVCQIDQVSSLKVEA